MSIVLKDGLNGGDLVGADAGIHTTVAASDTIQTNLRKVVYAYATLSSDPILAVSNVTIEVPDQIANPGKLTIKTWKATGAGDTTPIAATTFSKSVHWIAFGR
mgnify:CR=1 FL=1